LTSPALAGGGVETAPDEPADGWVVCALMVTLPNASVARNAPNDRVNDMVFI
jgi:hypothetical protein